MDAAVEQCEECLIEINITDYLRAVCRHLTRNPSPVNEQQSIINDKDSRATCSDMRNLHMLIKDKFRKIINVAFKQVPVHPDFYYCLPAWSDDKMVRIRNDITLSKYQNQRKNLLFFRSSRMTSLSMLHLPIVTKM